METLLWKSGLPQWCRFLRFPHWEVWDRVCMTECVYDTSCVFVWECVHLCERDFGCLRCSSQFISVDTWPNSWTHKCYSSVFSLRFFLSFRPIFPSCLFPFCVQLIVQFCASVFMFVRQCTCCLTIKAVDLKPGLGYVTWHGTCMCVCVCVCLPDRKCEPCEQWCRAFQYFKPSKLDINSETNVLLLWELHGGVTPRSWKKYSPRVFVWWWHVDVNNDQLV